MPLSNKDRQECFRRNRKAMRRGFYQPLPEPISVVWRGYHCIITSRARDGEWYCGTHTTTCNGRRYIARVVLTADEVEQVELPLD